MKHITENYRKQRLKSFKIIFEDTRARGFIGWTIIEDCLSMDDAIDYFHKHFYNKEITKISQINK